MRYRILAAALAVGLAATGLAAAFARPSAPARSTDTELSLVAYSTPREAYAKLIPLFQKTSAGDSVDFTQSYGSSGEQTRAIKAGLKADIAALSLAPDVDELVAAGMVDAKWKKQSYKGMVTNSLVVFVVRDGNPKKIKGWNDLLRPDVEIVTPNPFTSGGARWNVMAAYGSWRKAGKTDKQAQANLLKLFQNVVAGHERASLAQHLQQREGRCPSCLRERGVVRADAGPQPAVRHSEGDDPDREPDRRHQVEPGQDRGKRVPPLPSNPGCAADLRGQRIPACGLQRSREEPEEVPGSARGVHHRPARTRRLGGGAEALLRSEVERDGPHPATDRWQHWVRSPSATPGEPGLRGTGLRRPCPSAL